MTDITFITSNPTKLAHARHLCRGYDVNILQYRKLFYGTPYKEPRIQDQKQLLEESIKDAIERWKKNVSNYGNRLFFIEDTSVKIDALSDADNEIPGVDIKYWMQSHNFKQLNEELRKRGNNRKVCVSSHVILFLTNEIKNNIKTTDDYIIFKSSSEGFIVSEEQEIATQVLYPWLDNKSFNKWFVPKGFSKPISLLEISDADKVDFRRGAFEQMLNFLKEQNVIHHTQKEIITPRLPFKPLYIICGATCAGKSTIGKFLLENFDYYHIEASDFMSLRYFETHGTKFIVDKHLFSFELLKVSPLVVVDNLIDYIITKKIFDNFVITGFRTPNEISSFVKKFPLQSIKIIFVDAYFSVRFERWKSRQRDTEDYTEERFSQINTLQDSMGLLEIQKMDDVIMFENNKEGLTNYFNNFQDIILKENFHIPKYSSIELITESLKKLSLEKVILITLAIKYQENESTYFTTTEISHLINNTFHELSKNKNNISRYFNQAFYPYYEIKKESNKNKYKLSPTGYSEALFVIKEISKNM